MKIKPYKFVYTSPKVIIQIIKLIFVFSNENIIEEWRLINKYSLYIIENNHFIYK